MLHGGTAIAIINLLSGGKTLYQEPSNPRGYTALVKYMLYCATYVNIVCKSNYIGVKVMFLLS